MTTIGNKKGGKSYDNDIWNISNINMDYGNPQNEKGIDKEKLEDTYPFIIYSYSFKEKDFDIYKSFLLSQKLQLLIERRA